MRWFRRAKATRFCTRHSAAVSAENMKAFQILLAMMAVFAVVWFVVYKRRQSATPDKPEKALAYGWLILRRVACFSVAAFFAVAGIAVLVVPKQESSFASSVGAFLFCACVAFIAAWVGMYGGGRRRAMRDDKAVHQERKKRYG
jgi:predicted benzoate:H+ symporter BenE